MDVKATVTTDGKNMTNGLSNFYMKKLKKIVGRIRAKEGKTMISGAIKAYVINLDCDLQNFEKVESIAGEVPLNIERISGIRGSSIPLFLIEKTVVNYEHDLQMGTVGCFLSHVKAWEKIASNGSGFVFEDDITFQNMETLCELTEELQTYDLVFVNNRMCGEAVVDNTRNNCVNPLKKEILARSEKNQIACGGDGYYLSQAGAQRLVDLISNKGIFNDVDWFIFYCAVGNNNLDEIRGNRTFHRKLSFFSDTYELADPILKGGSLAKSLVTHAPTQSRRIIENKAN